MTSDAIHAIRSGIVNLSAQPHVTFSACVMTAVAEIAHLSATLFCWSDTSSHVRCWEKACIPHTQRIEYVLPGKLIECHSADARNDFAKRYETDIAINKASTRRTAKRFRYQMFDRFVVAGPTLTQIEIRSVASTMS